MDVGTASKPAGIEPMQAAVWVEVGRVLRPHGLDGALLVSLYGDDPANLLRADRVRLTGSAGEIEFRPGRARRAGAARGGSARVRLWIPGVERREQAEEWAGAVVAIPEAALEPLPEGEFYWRDLLGLSCRTLAGAELGVIEEIWPTGSNDVLVARAAGATHLIPALREVLVRVDRAAGVLWIDPPEGLLEDV